MSILEGSHSDVQKGGGGIFWEGEVDSHVSGSVAYSC